MSSIEVLVPVAPIRVTEQPLAPRSGDLGDGRIGLLDNGKANARLLLEELADELSSRAPALRWTRVAKPATAAAPEEVLDELRRCHAVVLAIAD